MPKTEIEDAVRLARLYIDSEYNPNAPGGVDAQKEQEDGVYSQVFAALAKKDQDVLKIWNLIRKKKK